MSLVPAAFPVVLQTVSTTSLLGLTVVCCVPPLHKPLRKFVQPWIYFHVQRGFSWISFFQRHQTGLITRLSTLSSLSVGVAFYVGFLVLIVLTGAEDIGSKATILLAWGQYVGNALKDLICAPRPIHATSKSGEVVTLLAVPTSEDGKLNAKEYGIPSSHTMNSLCLNFYIAIRIIEDWQLSPAASVVMYCLAAAWVVWIGIARVYLGMHTPIDVIGGAIAGTFVLLSYLAFADVIIDSLHKGYGVLIQLLVSAVLLRLHPYPENATPTIEFSAYFVGAAFGVGLGRWRLYSANMIPLPSAPDLWTFILQFVRHSLIGFTGVAICKGLSKTLLINTLPYVYAAVPLHVRKLWQPPMHHLGPGKFNGIPTDEKGLAYDISMTARFFSYASLSYIVYETLHWCTLYNL